MRRRSLRTTASHQVGRATQQVAATNQERQELVVVDVASTSEELPRIDRGLKLGLGLRSTRASVAASRSLQRLAESGPSVRSKPGSAASEHGPTTYTSGDRSDPSSSPHQGTRFGNNSQDNRSFVAQMSRSAATSAIEASTQRRRHLTRGGQQVEVSLQPGDGSGRAARPSLPLPQVTCSLEGYGEPSECGPNRMKPERSRSLDDRTNPLWTLLEQDRDTVVTFDEQIPPQTPISRTEMVSNDPHVDEQVSDTADADRVEREDAATGTSTDEIRELLEDSTSWVRLQLGPNLPLTCQYLPLHGTARFGRVEKMASGRYRLVLSMKDAHEKEADPSAATREYVYWLEPGKQGFSSNAMVQAGS
ncbi:hypothetical protein F1559_001108 [Cyanidiococcus yangmingshanensis]|uniref:Uncharacterized protein n=1 Tax=Cyanidiococcus yangmingshanensis TaxID=2690220 RepID=A0A7J7IMN6_9RHOD|nr:hypothetical protein F1559_001108 [Cyanidiococcus yangmingshanensis]